MNPLLEVLCNEINKLKKALTTTGSDYTATVTKVEGDTAYVQMSGSDISDTPVALSVNAAEGDHVRVRVANGKAWITGNDSSPPTDDTKAEQAIQETRAINERINNTEEAADGRYSKIEQTVDQITLEVGVAESKADTAQTTANGAQTTANGRMKADMSNKASSITINSGLMAFLSNTIKIVSSNFILDEIGNATFSGTIKGAKYVDSSQNFTMDIGSSEHVSGSVTPAFRIGGYVNGNPNNDYLDIEITLYKTNGSSIPTFYIAGTIKNSPNAAEKASVSIGLDDTGIHFYGSWSNGAHRVHSSLPWGYNP